MPLPSATQKTKETSSTLFRQVPGQWGKNDKANLEEDGKPHQNPVASPAQLARFRPNFSLEQPIRQHTPAARVFGETADHGSQGDNHGNKAKCVAHASLNRFQRLRVPRHVMAASPNANAMLEISIARKACIFTARIKPAAGADGNYRGSDKIRAVPAK